MVKTKNKNYLYVDIAQNIEQQILDGVLKMGDKLPSVRVLKQEYGVSISTILEAYYRLEGKNLVESRPRSGYYVIFCANSVPDCPTKTNPGNRAVLGNVTGMIIDFYEMIGDENMINFSLGVPAPELMPIAKMTKTIHETVVKLPAGGTYYDNIQGSLNLRRQIAQRTILWGGAITEQDLIITAGCTSALSLSLMAVTKSGDTIAVESPVYYGILQLANTLGLRVLELPTDPATGMDLDALQRILREQRIAAIMVVSNFSNPLGSLMPNKHKQKLVRIIQEYEIPLIEDDICGEIYYGRQRPSTCKYYDDSGLVMWVGSFSKTIGGGYRVGWVAPGKFISNVMKLKLYLSSSTSTIPQEAIANFLAKGRYDHHLRRLRETLHTNSIKYIGAISNYFPEDTKVSKPKGSFLLWVELNPKIDISVLFERAQAQHISFTPGSIFTLQKQYSHCMRLCYGIVWSEKIDQGLKKLGELAHEMLFDM
ncbi:PLP-dependent aminotransferase family protein [Aggregatimonas sangjinii]|uniref:PLP-dependent aminotransferase family protein n=1 Tax=Aggregatimonas sangjinii TaxID=2583587 RepID=A0A5B7SPI2_9FLAO|nr:PLP-dependent aminotransferase family protein [Aggregatimonas sangjinii]QCW99298.1 PLP-dependent aminotransferase family protein [Aggregatimonas sangjinii]